MDTKMGGGGNLLSNSAIHFNSFDAGTWFVQKYIQEFVHDWLLLLHSQPALEVTLGVSPINVSLNVIDELCV